MDTVPNIDTQHWTLPNVLREQAQKRPDKTAVHFIGEPGFSLTYQALYTRARVCAAGLFRLGVMPDDVVGVMLPNSPAFCESWCGIALSDGVMAAINTELRGDFLVHALNLSRAGTLICHQQYASRLCAILPKLEYLQTLIVVDSEPRAWAETGADVVDYAQLFDHADQRDAALKKGQDLTALIYTSGTSGPSKAVMMPHAHCYLFAKGTLDNLRFKERSSYYICMPLFHANGLLMQLYACLLAGATAFVRERFSASNWMADIHRYGVTHTNLLGVMSEFLEKQPPSTRDQQHQLEVIAAAPASPDLIRRFQRRFAVQVIELYGMSEVNIPLFTPLDAPRPGSCGKVYADYFDVRIASQETDTPVATGDVGEIQVRPKVAGGMMSGYFNMPEATVQAWRNLWFHTGDAGRMDADGYVYFVDRLKDCLRRRGENISSFEVEQIVLQVDAVSECAVLGVCPGSTDAEQEILAVLVCDDHFSLDNLAQHCFDQLPHFALPRFVRVIDAREMPRTATNKIQKTHLKSLGMRPEDHDLETHYAALK